MTEHKESLFCPLKQYETRQPERSKRKYYIGRCDEQKCSWWRITHSPSVNDGECAISNIANSLMEIRYKESES